MRKPGELPAYLGGEPAFPEGPPSWPVADPEIEEALRQAYADGSWGKYHGPHVPRLEETIREHLGVPHIVPCGSGTFAVELALRALKVGPGDEVILSSFDFPGNILAVLALGAMPVLHEICVDDWQLSIDGLRDAVTPRTKAILASHLHGGLVHMKSLRTLGIPIVEDACQCPGARFDGRPAGTWGDVGVFSFGGSKLLTAGRGGAIVTASAEIAQRAKTIQLRCNLVNPLSELQATVLVPQWKKLKANNATRTASVAMLREQLEGAPGLRMFPHADGAAYYKVGFQFDAAEFGTTREKFVAAMRAEGVAMDESFASQHVGRSPKRYRATGPLAEAERAHQGCVVLHHPVLLQDADAMRRIAFAIRRIREHLPASPSNT
ncbi:MAG: DegT/DnrJ/EryC1/StrS family aminotransferase [Gemmataceae bacterium]